MEEDPGIENGEWWLLCLLERIGIAAKSAALLILLSILFLFHTSISTLL